MFGINNNKNEAKVFIGSTKEVKKEKSKRHSPYNGKVVSIAQVCDVSDAERALKIAYEKCGTDCPKITIMPQGANTFPILQSSPH